MGGGRWGRLWVAGDGTDLAEAVLHYAGNAIKSTRQGSITRSAELLEDVDGELQVRFTGTDTGVGIEPEKLERLFQAFEQADTSITRRAPRKALSSNRRIP